MKNELRKMGIDELKLKKYSYLFLYIFILREQSWLREFSFFMKWVNSGPHSNTVGGDNAP